MNSEIELKKGEWSSFVYSGVFAIPESGTLELEGHSCTVVDDAGNEAGNLSTSDKECTVRSGYKGYVIRGKLRLS